jgi:hypothetical protein
VQILTLRKKLNYMFRVLTGTVTGHYVLDLRNENHRAVGEYPDNSASDWFINLLLFAVALP